MPVVTLSRWWGAVNPSQTFRDHEPGQLEIYHAVVRRARETIHAYLTRQGSLAEPTVSAAVLTVLTTLFGPVLLLALVGADVTAMHHGVHGISAALITGVNMILGVPALLITLNLRTFFRQARDVREAMRKYLSETHGLRGPPLTWHAFVDPIATPTREIALHLTTPETAASIRAHETAHRRLHGLPLIGPLIRFLRRLGIGIVFDEFVALTVHAWHDLRLTRWLPGREGFNDIDLRHPNPVAQKLITAAVMGSFALLLGVAACWIVFGQPTKAYTVTMAVMGGLVGNLITQYLRFDRQVDFREVVLVGLFGLVNGPVLHDVYEIMGPWAVWPRIAIGSAYSTMAGLLIFDLLLLVHWYLPWGGASRRREHFSPINAKKSVREILKISGTFDVLRHGLIQGYPWFRPVDRGLLALSTGTISAILKIGVTYTKRFHLQTFLQNSLTCAWSWLLAKCQTLKRQQVSDTSHKTPSDPANASRNNTDQLSRLMLSVLDMNTLKVRGAHNHTRPSDLYQAIDSRGLLLLAELDRVPGELSIPNKYHPITLTKPENDGGPSSETVVIHYRRIDHQYRAIEVYVQQHHFAGLRELREFAERRCRELFGALAADTGTYFYYAPKMVWWRTVKASGIAPVRPVDGADKDRFLTFEDALAHTRAPGHAGVLYRVVRLAPTKPSALNPDYYAPVEVWAEGQWISFEEFVRSREGFYEQLIPPAGFDVEGWVVRFIQLGREKGKRWTRLVFEPGATWRHMREWWGDKIIRSTSHEGDDASTVMNEDGHEEPVEIGGEVPSPMDGTVVSRQGDFMSETLFIRLEKVVGRLPWLRWSISADFRGEFEWHVYLMHGDPLLKKGDRVKRGEVITTIADPRKKQSPAPPHTHIGLLAVKRQYLQTLPRSLWYYARRFLGYRFKGE